MKLSDFYNLNATVTVRGVLMALKIARGFRYCTGSKKKGEIAMKKSLFLAFVLTSCAFCDAPQSENNSTLTEKAKEKLGDWKEKTKETYDRVKEKTQEKFHDLKQKTKDEFFGDDKFCNKQMVKNAILFQERILENSKEYHSKKERDGYFYPLFDAVKKIYATIKNQLDPELFESEKKAYETQIVHVSSKAFHAEAEEGDKDEIRNKEFALRAANYISMFPNEEILSHSNKRVAAFSGILFLVKNGRYLEKNDIEAYLSLVDDCSKDLKADGYHLKKNRQKMKLEEFLLKHALKIDGA